MITFCSIPSSVSSRMLIRGSMSVVSTAWMARTKWMCVFRDLRRVASSFGVEGGGRADSLRRWRSLVGFISESELESRDEGCWSLLLCCCDGGSGGGGGRSDRTDHDGVERRSLISGDIIVSVVGITGLTSQSMPRYTRRIKFDRGGLRRCIVGYLRVASLGGGRKLLVDHFQKHNSLTRTWVDSRLSG